MKRTKTNEMPVNIKNQLDEVLAQIPAKGRITSVGVVIDESIAKLFNIGQRWFSPRLSKDNFYTYGATYNKITKIVNTIKNCEYLSEPVVALRRKYTGSGNRVAPHVTATIGTDREHWYYEYSIRITFTGMTPERVEEIRLYKEEQERKRAEADAHRARVKAHLEYWENLHKDEVYEYLGCANGWGNDVPELVKIADADDDCFFTYRTTGRCQTEYICHKYKFYYSVDSSD